MTTSQYSLKPLLLSEPAKQDTQQLINLQRSLGQMTTEFVNKDIQTIQSETSKIQGFANGINNVIQKINGYKQQCTKTISDLEAQVDDLHEKIKLYERNFKNNNKENQYRKQIQTNQKKYLAEWEKRIQIASKIDTDALIKVDIEDRKSKANDVFKWIIIGIYGEPDTKFYWPNFRHQIFEKDQGKDFRQRMGKINASNAREEQRVKTEDFLKTFQEIAASKQLKKVSTQIEQIRKVAEIYLNCYEISKTIKNLQSLIEKSRQQSRQRDEQAMRWKARAEALQDRISTNKEYLAILNKIESLLAGKVQNYTEKQQTAKQISQRLKESGTISHLEISIEDDKREHCECAIF